MSNYNYILFDLDGTLTDSAEGITKAVAIALKKQGIIENDLSKLRPFIGPPLVQSFPKYYGFSEEQTMQAVHDYREYYNETGVYENYVYEGIPEVLQKLKDAGKHLVVATAKPEETAEDVLRHFNLWDYFEFLGGALVDGSRIYKNDILTYTIAELAKREGVAPDAEFKKTVLMVGDRDQDVNGAKDNNLDVVGVLYGFGDLEELQGAGATYLAKNPEDILDYAL